MTFTSGSSTGNSASETQYRSANVSSPADLYYRSNGGDGARSDPILPPYTPASQGFRVGWFRLETDFSDHPKIAAAGFCAELLYVRCIGYAHRHETDGFIPIKVAGKYASDINASTCDAMADALVTNGLWETVDGGWQIHDYLMYQPSRSDRQQERERVRESMKEIRARRKPLQRNNGVTDEVLRRNTAVSYEDVTVLTTTSTPTPTENVTSTTTNTALQRNNGVTPPPPQVIELTRCDYEDQISDEAIIYQSKRLSKTDPDLSEQWVRAALRAAQASLGPLDDSVVLERFIRALEDIQRSQAAIKAGQKKIAERFSRYAAGIFRKTMAGDYK